MSRLVLIVDDERTVALALSRQLRQLGVQVLVVDDPTEVEEAVKANVITAVICDKRMPLRSGVEVLLALKDQFPGVSRCLLTGSLSELTQTEVEQLSPCTLISKPWSSEDLAQLVRDWGLVAAP